MLNVDSFFSIISLSDANTTCTDSTCVVNWEHRSNIVPCTNYSVKVGIDTVQIITLPPGIFVSGLSVAIVS